MFTWLIWLCLIIGVLLRPFKPIHKKGYPQKRHTHMRKRQNSLYGHMVMVASIGIMNIEDPYQDHLNPNLRNQSFHHPRRPRPRQRRDAAHVEQHPVRVLVGEDASAGGAMADAFRSSAVIGSRDGLKDFLHVGVGFPFLVFFSNGTGEPSASLAVGFRVSDHASQTARLAQTPRLRRGPWPPGWPATGPRPPAARPR